MRIDRIRSYRDRYTEALLRGRLEQARELACTLERLDARHAARWAHRAGDLARRLGSHEAAARAYARAERAYADAGFSRQASAMQCTRRSTLPPARAV